MGTGTSYVNQHGVSGLVVPPRDPRALAEAINSVLADAVWRRRLAQGARTRAALFTLERMSHAVEQVYIEVRASTGIVS